MRNSENVSLYLKSQRSFFKLLFLITLCFSYTELVSYSNTQPQLFLSLCCYCKWIPVERPAVPRGHASLLPSCALLSPTMPLASCMMYVDPPLCRARLNLLVYSSSQVVTPGSQYHALAISKPLYKVGGSLCLIMRHHEKIPTHTRQ